MYIKYLRSHQRTSYHAELGRGDTFKRSIHLRLWAYPCSHLMFIHLNYFVLELIMGCAFVWFLLVPHILRHIVGICHLHRNRETYHIHIHINHENYINNKNEKMLRIFSKLQCNSTYSNDKLQPNWVICTISSWYTLECVNNGLCHKFTPTITLVAAGALNVVQRRQPSLGDLDSLKWKGLRRMRFACYPQELEIAL